MGSDFRIMYLYMKVLNLKTMSSVDLPVYLPMFSLRELIFRFTEFMTKPSSKKGHLSEPIQLSFVAIPSARVP